MAWTNLPTNYTDASWSGNRKYQQITNSDGTVSFVDKTVYTNKENSFFGAKDANQTNDGINQAMAQLASIDTAYKAADSNFQKLLNTETTKRINAINELQSQINSEISNRTMEDNYIQSDLNDVIRKANNISNTIDTGAQYYFENVDWRIWQNMCFGIYRYEGESWADLFAFPRNNGFIMVIRSKTRGVAMYQTWASVASLNSKIKMTDNYEYRYRLWITFLHDDTGTDRWVNKWYNIPPAMNGFQL